ncbi:uncharacterized protein [Engystomops pustulosus]|uniref:uncharacterized protein isoform X2 n=1 Tax=Engystomops pustulosus TaxID=76066 RepID=UPI003AFAA5D6
MERAVPSSVIIPAVAARLKYYLDVERKEVGFDLSVNPTDSTGNKRLYQSAGRRIRHQPPRPKENLLDNKLEASLRSYTRAGWTKKVEINPDYKLQVQRRIREKMSSFTIPERFARNYVFLRDVNWKCSDWKVVSLGIDRRSRQAVSQGEFRRLISSAANLIVATTSEHHLQDLHHHRRGSPLKPSVRQSLTSARVNIPTACEEPSPGTETSSLDGDGDTYKDQSLNVDIRKNQVPASDEDIDYEIAVHTIVRDQEEASPSMFIRLYGASGRSRTLILQNPLPNSITSGAGQALIFHVKTKDLGEVTDLCIGIHRKDRASPLYCKKVIVKKGTTEYVFPYNNWLSPCNTIKAQISAPDTTANRAQTARHKDNKNCQKTRDKRRPTTSKPLNSKDNDLLVSSKELGFPHIHEEKLETAKKENRSDLDSDRTNNTKSTKSPRMAEGHTPPKPRTSLRSFGSSTRRRQVVPASGKQAKVLVSSEKTGTSRVISAVDKRFTSMTSDVRKEKPVLEVGNTDEVTSTNSSSGKKLNTREVQKHSRASSPAGYVFFAVESKESSVIVQVNGCSKRYTQDGSTGGRSKMVRRESSTCVNNEPHCPGENKNYLSSDKGSSELALLQEILSDSGNDVTYSSLDSQPFSSCGNNEEERDRREADEDVTKEHRKLRHHNKLCSQADCEAKMTSGYSCSCEDHSLYETDSTLDEEYFFSDTTLEPSLSDDDYSDSSSKCNVLNPEPESSKGEQNVVVMKNRRHQIRRQRRVESCSENSIIFQRSLAAIHNGDDRTLRNLCQSHFFLPSVTDEEGKTLLHHAATQENPSICQVLLGTNIGLVNIDQQDKSGKTALHHAVQKGNSKTVKILLDNGAKSEIQDKKAMTALDIGLRKVQAK